MQVFHFWHVFYSVNIAYIEKVINFSLNIQFSFSIIDLKCLVAKKKKNGLKSLFGSLSKVSENELFSTPVPKGNGKTEKEFIAIEFFKKALHFCTLECNKL